MAGNLYQLKTAALPGQHVTFAGTHDKYGLVMELQNSGYHLIRGLGMKPPAGVTAFIIAHTED